MIEQIRKKIFLVISLIFLFGILPVEAGSVRLTVSPDRGRKEISVGDRFYISIDVSDIDGSPEQPATVPGAKVLYFQRTGQRSSFTNINGKASQSVSYTWTLTLRAEKEGQYKFGPISVGGIQSNEVAYAIGAPMPSQQNVPSQSQGGQTNRQTGNGPTFIGKGDGNLFLRAEVSQSSAYVQQAIIYTVKLYSTYEAIKFIGATASPKFDGFVVEESKDISTSLEFETYNGKTYATAIIARYIIFPQMEGTLKVTGNTYTVSVDEREYYHDPFWGNMAVSKPLQLNVTPNDLNIKVKGLPKPVPSDFSGGVGHFKLNSSLKGDTLLTNQASSIVYTVEGSGNLKYVTLPDLQKLYPPELEVYTPTSETNVKVGRSEVSGNIKFDYSFMPLESGNFRIPEVTLVYFNPATEKYERSVARGYDLHVERGQGSENSQTKATLRFNPDLMTVDNNLSFVHKPYVYGFLYWLFYIIPLILIVGSYIYYRTYQAANSDVLAVKSRKANKMARKRLKKAYSYMQQGNKEIFYDEIIRSLWGYVGDKLRIPTSELSRENVYGKLAMKNIPEDKISDLISLIDDVEFEKYAPIEGQSEMNKIYDRSINMMNELEESFKKS